MPPNTKIFSHNIPRKNYVVWIETIEIIYSYAELTKFKQTLVLDYMLSVNRLLDYALTLSIHLGALFVLLKSLLLTNTFFIDLLHTAMRASESNG